ncbi:MAG: hypothetical protein GY934_06410 [Gammaproteobacteria bacterium]|nr:hypothetical protein [Gammaproteobacteria bacterium]
MDEGRTMQEQLSRTKFGTRVEKDTTPGMGEVERHRKPKPRIREYIKQWLIYFDPLTPTLSLLERELTEQQ